MHHRHYRNLYHETSEDLMELCVYHHSLITNARRNMKLTNEQATEYIINWYYWTQVRIDR